MLHLNLLSLFEVLSGTPAATILSHPGSQVGGFLAREGKLCKPLVLRQIEK